MNKWPLYLLILLIVSSFSIAVPPSEQIFLGNDGLEIEYPKLDIYEVGNSHTAHFHVFNLSNGYNFKDGDDVNCTLHVYSQNQRHIYTNWSTTFDDTYDIEFYLSGSLFTEAGTYSNIIQCTHENSGGFSSFPFFITYDGVYNTEKDTYSNIIWSKMFLIILLITIIIWVFSNDIDTREFWLGVNFSVIAILQIISLFVYQLIYRTDGDISALLRIDIYILLLNGFLWFAIYMFTLVLKMFDGTKDGDKWNDSRERKKW